MRFLFFASIPPPLLPLRPPRPSAAPPSQLIHNSSHPHFSHLTYHIAHLSHHLFHHRSSQLHFSHHSHHSSTSHTSLIILSQHNSSLLRGQQTAFRVAGAAHRASWSNCGAHGRCWAAAAFRVASAVHRASWTSCGARGRRWVAAAFCVAGVVTYGHTSRHFVLITADGSDLVCRSFSVDLAFLSSTVM